MALKIDTRGVECSHSCESECEQYYYLKHLNDQRDIIDNTKTVSERLKFSDKADSHAGKRYKAFSAVDANLLLLHWEYSTHENVCFA